MYIKSSLSKIMIQFSLLGNLFENDDKKVFVIKIIATRCSQICRYFPTQVCLLMKIAFVNEPMILWQKDLKYKYVQRQSAL